MLHFTDAGLRNVWLTNGYVEKEMPYGTAVSYPDLDGLIRTVCLALAHKPGKLAGAEFRYLRNALLLSQKSLGNLLGCTEQSVAKWEKQGRIPKAEDFLIRLIYTQKHDGMDNVAIAVDALKAIDHVGNSRIIVSRTGDKWTWKLAVEGNEQLLEPA
ncbi:transcriptional regulator [Massilia antarctica]|uniref:transcriptional regulator n=1 Tax=Massilia antarctica TaxID=2765360 RepID=UPI0006BB886F|nr:transcriptional regulator [Massilia sp. H27-R4]MCY0913413.1 transcriptional regulator [Massilia sp. H27-R4]